MNYKLLFQLEAQQNKLLHKKISEYENELKQLLSTRDEALNEVTKYKKHIANINNRITSYTKDLQLDIKA